MYDGVNTSEMFKKETNRLELGKTRTLNVLELYGLAIPGKLREQLKLITWIRRVAALNDLDLDDELKLINKNSLNVFARVISHIHHPELDSHTYRNGTYEAHPHADTIDLLVSIGVYIICHQFGNTSQFSYR
ncbi:hypothetical protein BDEG_28337 [Batrachochytrium dendrobatidis JEL423]|uniref:Uncharacterized protein n=1 Tax=Batrachochytrium dendrobatidis (strain JEL423) TaxID=403673 RepID=A0A177WYY7_BATDL|nr:hypothetical protein BDEG_28337 [Batrachochytrium dendrobatidis JEL423]